MVVISTHSVIIPSTLLMHTVWYVSIQYLLQSLDFHITAGVLRIGFCKLVSFVFLRRHGTSKSDARLQLYVLCGITYI